MRSAGTCWGIANRTSRLFWSLFFLGGQILCGQTATYHLHNEASTTTPLKKLTASGPDVATVELVLSGLGGATPNEYLLQAFDTQAGVPGAGGTIAAGSSVNFTLWMKRSGNGGAFSPRAKLFVNSPSGAALCAATGGSALTTTLTQYNLSCTTGAAVTMTSADRYYLWVGVNVTTTPSGSATARLSIEGTLNGNYDSLVTVPLPVTAPQIISLTPPSGEIGTSVTIAGSGFGATQSSSSVKFNGVPATPANWSANSISAPAPFGATTGPVVVTVNGIASNETTFTVSAGAISGVISRSADGSAVNGATVEAMQSGVVKLSTTSGSGGAYTLAGLATGTYDVRTLAAGLLTATNPGVSVTTGSTTTLNVNLAPMPPISYAYDEGGRLTGVSDPNSDSVRYAYDATGNLLSISRQSTSQVAILEFNPDQGVAGTAVTVYGTSFSQTPNQNTVQFNGVVGAVTSSTATKIVATVPVGATTGPITVTAPAGSATSAVPFVIPGEVTAEITPGGPPVTVVIPTAGQNARVRITGATPGQRVTVTMSGISIAQSDVSMLNPDGSTLVAPQLVTPQQLGFIDVQTLSASGQYAILVDPRSAYTGSMRLAVRPIADVTGTITTDGQPLVVNITDPGQNARLTFAGTAGHKMSLRLDSISVSGSDITVLTPTGGTLTGPLSCTLQDVFLIDGLVLPESGAFTILMDPRSANTGRTRMRLNEFADVTGPILAGGPPVDATISAPGQNMALTFSGISGQRMSLTGWASGEAPSSEAYLKILSPDGSTLDSNRAVLNRCSYGNCYGFTFLEVTLPSNGQYMVLFHPVGSILPYLKATLYDIPADVTGSVTVNGSAVPVTITTPGQNAQFGFSGTAGQQVTVHITGNTLKDQDGSACGSSVYLRAPDGSTLTYRYSADAAFDLTPQVLGVNGEHTVRIDPLTACKGSLNVSVTSP